MYDPKTADRVAFVIKQLRVGNADAITDPDYLQDQTPSPYAIVFYPSQKLADESTEELDTYRVSFFHDHVEVLEG